MKVKKINAIVKIINENKEIGSYYCGNSNHCHTELPHLVEKEREQCHNCDLVNVKPALYPPQEYSLVDDRRGARPQAAPASSQMAVIIRPKNELKSKYFEFHRPINMPFGENETITEVWYDPGVWVKYDGEQVWVGVTEELDREFDMNIRFLGVEKLKFGDKNGIGRIAKITKDQHDQKHSQTRSLKSLVAKTGPWQDDSQFYVCRNSDCMHQFPVRDRTYLLECPECLTSSIGTKDIDTTVYFKGKETVKMWTSPKGVQIYVHDNGLQPQRFLRYEIPRTLSNKDIDVVFPGPQPGRNVGDLTGRLDTRAYREWCEGKGAERGGRNDRR